MGRLALLAVDFDVVDLPAALDLRTPDVAVASDRGDLHFEDAE